MRASAWSLGWSVSGTPGTWRKRTSSPRSGRQLFVIRHFVIIEIEPMAVARIRGLRLRRRLLHLFLKDHYSLLRGNYAGCAERSEVPMSGQTWTWVGFILFVLAMLALDLGVFHRKSHEVKIREALAWSGVWIILALLFNLGVYYWRGPEPALAFLTGYLIEKSLSVDN